jgi:hypothetical protein
VILLDRSLNCALEPFEIGLRIGVVEMGVYLESEVGEERRLRPAEVVASITVEDLAIMFDQEYEVIDDAFGKGDFPVDDEPESDEVGVPVVELLWE